MPTMKFTVPGDPMGKPRMTRADKWKRRAPVLKYRSWADWARLCVRSQVGALPAAEKTILITFRAYFTPPESWSKKRREAAIGQMKRTKPDGDNCLKMLDCFYAEDSALGDLHVIRRFDWEARLEVEIEYEGESVANALAIAA